MINYLQSLQLLKLSAKKFSNEKISILNSVGKISAENVKSKINVPSFTNSAMDGFAIKIEQTKFASAENPIPLPIRSVIEAGDLKTKKSSGIFACEIMTGAVLPKNFDCVIPVENAEIFENKFLRITAPITVKSNVRHVGEDFKSGEKIISVGDLITSEHLMALAATGQKNIKIKKIPQIAIVATGKEVSDNYGGKLNGAEIYNSNSPYLVSCLSKLGYETKYYGIVKDRKSDFHKLMDKIEKEGCKIVISTGAVSAGKKDFIKEALLERKMKIIFHKVAIKPGKPILFAAEKKISKSGGIYFFGLPGNPISTMVGLHFFVRPFIANCLGLNPFNTVTATLQEPLNIKSGLRHFLKAHSFLSDGKLLVKILSGQESFKIKPLLQANSFVICDGGEKKSGEVVEVLPLALDLCWTGFVTPSTCSCNLKV